MTAATDSWFEFGIVAGTHGIRGDLKVRPLTAGSDALLGAGRVRLQAKDGTDSVVEPARLTVHKDVVLMRLQGLDNINLVTHLLGAKVFMLHDDLADPGEDTFYWHEIEGLNVVDRQLGELGQLADLMSTSAHDIYVVRGGRYGEVLIPVVSAMVVSVDPDAGVIQVDLPEGLIS